MRLLTIKERQHRMLEIMKDVDAFCRSHKIPYTLCGGTLLGAVRHNGFIPWDDDLDIYMLRADYERFKLLYKSNSYRILTNSDTDHNILPVTFSKVTDPNTFTLNKDNIREHGVFIDVFPLDAIPENPDLQKKYTKKLVSLNNRFYHRHKNDILSIIKSHAHPLHYWAKRIKEMITSCDPSKCKEASNLMGCTGTIVKIPINAFNELKDILFEDSYFLSIKDTDSYLQQLYGPNYMIPKRYPLHQEKIYVD